MKLDTATTYRLEAALLDADDAAQGGIDARLDAIRALLCQALAIASELDAEANADARARFVNAAENGEIMLEVKRRLCRQRLAEQGIVPDGQNTAVRPDDRIPPALLIQAMK